MRKMLLLVILLLAAGLALCQTPMQLLHTIESPFVNDSNSWGGSVKGNGDINGDGFNDIIISGRPIDSGLGRRDVYIYLGGQALSNTADFIITDPSSPGPYHWFGSSIAYNGDINGDGYCDLVVSETGYGIDNWGRVLVYNGGPSFDIIPDLIFDGFEYGMINFGLKFGSNIDLSGDFNGDGYNDLVVSSEHSNLFHYGQINIFYGGPGLDTTSDWFYYGEMSEEFGAAMAVGDINDDGFSDLASISLFTGSSSGQNRVVKLFLGGLEFSNQVDRTYSFDQDYTWPVMFMDGDVNRDGFDDLVLKKSTNKILFGSANLSDSFGDLSFPLIGSESAYYASSNDTTFIANIRGTVSPYSMDYSLSSYLSEGQWINDYQYSYNPDPINDCKFGYFLGDVNNDGGIELLVTNRINNEVFFYVVSTHNNPDLIVDNNIISPIQSLSVFPNPFTQSSTLSYDLKQPGMIGLYVYNIKGQLVAKLDDGYKRAGQNSANWDGNDKHGHTLPSGIYLLKLKLDDKFITCKKVTLCY